MNLRLKQSLYPADKLFGFTEVDGTMLFYNFINSRLTAGSVVLDFGAGRGAAAEDACPWRKALAATSLVQVKRIAVDVDPAVMNNPFAQEKHVMAIVNNSVRIPLPDASVDVIICDWVVEHLPNPAETFAEFSRVLRTNGTVAIRTSNKWHYAYLAARLIGGTKAEAAVLKRAQPDRKEEDVFPKIYRANSISKLRSELERAGLSSTAVFTWDSEPAYVGRSWLAGCLGFFLHRLALLGLLPRATLFGFAVKS